MPIKLILFIATIELLGRRACKSLEVNFISSHAMHLQSNIREKSQRSLKMLRVSLRLL